MSAGCARDVRQARRILCYGATGSGKSTLALALGERLGLPVVLVDELRWEPGWVEVTRDEQARRMLPLLEQERWVLDSAYSSIAPRALERANVIIALDYPRLTSLTRLIRRTARRIRTREPICNGNVETLPRALGTDSIIRWHFRSWKGKRRWMRAWHADPAAPPVLLLRTPSDADALLEALGGAERDRSQ